MGLILSILCWFVPFLCGPSTPESSPAPTSAPTPGLLFDSPLITDIRTDTLELADFVGTGEVRLGTATCGPGFWSYHAVCSVRTDMFVSSVSVQDIDIGNDLIACVIRHTGGFRYDGDDPNGILPPIPLEVEIKYSCGPDNVVYTGLGSPMSSERTVTVSPACPPEFNLVGLACQMLPGIGFQGPLRELVDQSASIDAEGVVTARCEWEGEAGGTFQARTICVQVPP